MPVTHSCRARPATIRTWLVRAACTRWEWANVSIKSELNEHNDGDYKAEGQV